jgi:hypothetical protein
VQDKLLQTHFEQAESAAPLRSHRCFEVSSKSSRKDTGINLPCNMSQTYSHHDASRNQVGSTAHFVAALRAKESNSAAPLFNDPYAQHLAGDFIEQTTEFMFPSASDKDGDASREEGVKKTKVVPKGSDPKHP